MQRMLRLATRSTCFGLLLLAAMLLSGCTRSPSEEALRATMDAMHDAGQNRAVGDFMEHVAEDFVGNRGEFDRRQLELLLRAVAMRHQTIGVTRAAVSIEITGDRAVVQMQLLVTGGSGGMLPDSGQLFDTESAWRFADGEWQLGSATWKPAS